MSRRRDDVYGRFKRPSAFSIEQLTAWLGQVDETRVKAIGERLASYLEENLTKSVDAKDDLASYRTNPFVNVTAAKTMGLEDPERFAQFLFNSKLYAGLETSFGKSLETEFLSLYPDPKNPWSDAEEKIAEFAALEGLKRDEKAKRRDVSIWREIDKSLFVGKRRFLLLIKSGPNTINDTQVAAMKDAIADHYEEWYDASKKHGASELDVVVGLMYGTDRTTNNKEIQILVKLTEHGFVEDRSQGNGTFVSKTMPGVRVYRRVGRDFWALVGSPEKPASAGYIFVEVVLGLIAGLKQTQEAGSIKEAVSSRINELAEALKRMAKPSVVYPAWVTRSFTQAELQWFIVALSSFFDEGL